MNSTDDEFVDDLRRRFEKRRTESLKYRFFESWSAADGQLPVAVKGVWQNAGARRTTGML
jgi:hypothetical protein